MKKDSLCQEYFDKYHGRAVVFIGTRKKLLSYDDFETKYFVVTK